MKVAVILFLALLGAAAGAPLPRLVRRWSVPSCHPAPATPGYGTRSLRHPWLLPLLCAVAFPALAWRAPGFATSGSSAPASGLTLPGWPPSASWLTLTAWLVFAWAGVALSAVDILVRRLPRMIIVGAAAPVVTLVTAHALFVRSPALLVLPSATGVIFALGYLLPAAVGPGLVGAGDVRLATLIGFLLGTGPPGSVLLGAGMPYLLAAPVIAAHWMLRRIRHDSTVALGPYLVAGALLAKVIAP